MNWKGHVIFGIMMGLPFISSPEQIFLVIAGALYPDLDHDVKSEIVERGLYISGALVLISILVYIFKPKFFDLGFFIAAVSILILYLIPYFANHRRITHTLLGLIVVSSILGFTSYKIGSISPIMAGLLSLIMVTNDKLLGKVVAIGVFVWIALTVISQYLVNFDGFYHYAIPIGLGYLSHIVGDSLTPMGSKPFYPLNYKFRKKEGIAVIVIWAIVVLYLIIKKYVMIKGFTVF